MRVKKICYACGLLLNHYPYDPKSFISNPEVICSCCGIHYGYDDDGAGEVIPDELTYSGWKFGDKNHIKIMKFWRQYWIDNGMKWWSQDTIFHPEPSSWNPIEQLKSLPEEFK